MSRNRSTTSGHPTSVCVQGHSTQDHLGLTATIVSIRRRTPSERPDRKPIGWACHHHDRPRSAVATARMLGEEHSDRNTAKVETDRIHGDGHHALVPHLVPEAGSIVLHVSEDGEEEGGTAAARENDEISRKDAEIRRFIELRRSTPKGRQTTNERIEQKHQKCIRDKKRMKRQQDIQPILEDFKGVSNIPRIKSAKKKVLTSMEMKATLTCTSTTLKK